MLSTGTRYGTVLMQLCSWWLFSAQKCFKKT